jgi:hypothetical protein
LFDVFYEEHNDMKSSLVSSELSTKRTQAERRATAYVAMSSLVQSVRGESSPTGDIDDEATTKGTKLLVEVFRDLVLDGLHSSHSVEQTGALALVSALFDVDNPSAVGLIRDATILNAIMELLDSPLKDPVDVQMARLIERAMAHSLSRGLMREECDFRVVRWLMSMAEEGTNLRTGGKISRDRVHARTTATLALVILVQGTEQDQQSSKYVPSSSTPSLPSPQQLAQLLQRAIIDTPISSLTSGSNDSVDSSLLDAVEGLAYLSAYPSIRTQVTSSTPLLKALFELSAATTKRTKPPSSLSSNRLLQTNASVKLAQTNLAMHYGLALLFANLCKYKPILSQEEQQIKKLKQMAKPPSSSTASSKVDTAQADEEEEENASNAAVLSRTRALCKAGILPALAGLARSPSAPARACVASAYLGVIQDSASRGEVLKNGGGKALLGIVAEDRKPQERKVPDWMAIQALSKLAITASPLAVFGPDPGATHDAIGPLASVLTYSAETNSTRGSAKRGPLTLGVAADGGPTQLQRFEAIMALTNIASLGPDMAGRIIKVNGLVREVESLLVEEHVLIRRAAVELVCNLVSCEEGSNLFLPGSSAGGSRAQSRLHILVALSDVEDMPTRKAASGALAMLTSQEAVCLGLVRLQKERGTVLRILGRLLLEEVDAEEDKEDKEDTVGDLSKRLTEMSIADADLVHRGIVILRNLAILVIQPQKPAWREFVSDLVREGIVESVEAVVKDCMQSGEEKASGPVVENALEFGLALKSASDMHGV